jgi:hypothetical protein
MIVTLLHMNSMPVSGASRALGRENMITDQSIASRYFAESAVLVDD